MSTVGERVLMSILADLMPNQKIYTESNFFEIGGDSLLATRLVFRVNQQLGIRLKVRTVFETPGLKQIGSEVARLCQEKCDVSYI